MERKDTIDPFEPETLQSMVENELIELGWIETVTDEIRARVKTAIEIFVNDRSIASASDTQIKLARACIVRSNRLNHLPALKSIRLNEVGINKPESESLPNGLYPMVFFQMLNKSGFDGSSILHDAFEELSDGKKKINKTELLSLVHSKIIDADWPEALQLSFLESLESLFSSPAARERLGHLLFLNNPDALKKWIIIFSRKNRELVIPGEVPRAQDQLIHEFLGKVRYFAGSPVKTPGLEMAFKQMLQHYVGPTEIKNLSIKTDKDRFVVRLSGQTKVDRALFKSFLERLKTEWTSKFEHGEPLKIKDELLTNGGAGGGSMII